MTSLILKKPPKQSITHSQPELYGHVLVQVRFRGEGVDEQNRRDESRDQLLGQIQPKSSDPAGLYFSSTATYVVLDKIKRWPKAFFYHTKQVVL